MSTDNFANCRKGFVYKRISDNIITGGLLVDYDIHYKTKKSLRNKYYRHIVKMTDVESAISKVNNLEKNFNTVVENEKQSILSNYALSGQCKHDYASYLEIKLKEYFSSLHDYRQFVSQITQNINVIIEGRYRGRALPEKLEIATHEEKAIYYSSKIMEEKLTTNLILNNKNDINNKDKLKTFRLHGLVHKYKEIYKLTAESKGITIDSRGQSSNLMRANPKAVSVIPHTLIDNALKFSPKGATVSVFFKDSDESTLLKISSYGPIIDDDEHELIFTLFYRGRNAKKTTDGTGFGLYLSQHIATELGTKIYVTQDVTNVYQNNFMTSFQITFKTFRDTSTSAADSY